jgi:hypothetical protein
MFLSLFLLYPRIKLFGSKESKNQRDLLADTLGANRFKIKAVYPEIKILKLWWWGK